jgi:hypothetical protein
MPPEVLESLLKRLLSSSQQRPDLLSEAQGGPSFGSPSYRPTGQQQAATFLGRVVRPEDANLSATDIMARFPQGELESGGMSLDVLKAGIPLWFWKDMAPEAKAFVSEYANRYPVSFERLLKQPQDVYFQPQMPDIPGVTPDMNGLYEGFGKAARISLSPDAQLNETIRRGAAKHEIGHSFHNDRILNASPEDAATIGVLLAEELRKTIPFPTLDRHYGSLSGALNKFSVLPQAAGLAGRLKDLANNPDLVQRVARMRSMPSPIVSGPYPTSRTRGPKAEHLKKLIGDEAMAYTGQHADDPQATSLLRLLAARLGIMHE